jgi:hypothetical protein
MATDRAVPDDDYLSESRTIRLMPFRLQVSDVSDKGADLSISGQLVEGSYMGPEAVLLCDQDGQWIPSDYAARDGSAEGLAGHAGRWVNRVLHELAQNVVPELAWEFTEYRGWTNNWRYSQRNPASGMSILGLEDNRFIRAFFSF